MLQCSKNTKQEKVAFGHGINISFSRYDYLKISNDVNETFGTYCGDRTGRTVTVTGNQVVMTFHSDQSVQKRGFVITLTSTPIGKCNRNAF